ncbi:MAG TPA: Hpt domain-containing protein [Bacteriovoracaceae bacterium]|nr:Hpt domain-containing protein [Bacteriovoracaceae bacterium]
MIHPTMNIPLELKEKYLRRRIIDLQVMRSSLENDDYSFAFRLGHQVKGNALTFDIPQIADIGSELEAAALKKDKLQIESLIVKMEFMIRSAQEELAS